jgi:ankyrin repeat protein
VTFSIIRAMKYRQALYYIGGILFVGLLLAGFQPAGHHRLGRHGQQWVSERNLDRMASSLMAYAEDHSENFPVSIGGISDQSFEQYGFAYNLYGRGDHIRASIPSDLEPSPVVMEAFGHYSYIATKDRCRLVVFERPGMWDDHTVAYVELDLKGRWKWAPESGLERLKATRVKEQQFADYVAKLELPMTDPSPADRLLAAAESGEIEEVESLLEKGSAIDGQDRRGWTALNIAAQSHQVKVVELLISKGAKINLRDNVGQGRTALMRASNLGYANVVDVLLSHGADVRVPLDDGSTVLMEALPYPTIVEKLLTAGANINERSQYLWSSWSPLIAASSAGHAETIRVLIADGADLRKDSAAALDWASRNGHADVIEVLLSNGAGADKKVLGECLTSAYSHTEAMKSLIEGGADLNAKCTCPGRRTALMISAANGCPETLDLLIAAGADLNLRDDDGCNALDLALASLNSEWMAHTAPEKRRFETVVDTLRKHGGKESAVKAKGPEN